MPSNDKLRAAVRGLRLALGKTQTEFGGLIGKSLPTIQRYEALVPPKGKILLKLEQVARDHRFDEYAQTFRDALRSEFGMDLSDAPMRPVEVPFPVVTGPDVGEPKSDEEQMAVAALLMLSAQLQWQGSVGERARKEWKIVSRGLRRVRGQLENSVQGNFIPADRVRAIVRLKQDGIPPKKIAEKLGISTEEVESLLSLTDEGEA